MYMEYIYHLPFLKRSLQAFEDSSREFPSELLRTEIFRTFIESGKTLSDWHC